MSPDDFPPPVICVIDANVLIDMKKNVGVDQLWGLLMEMHRRVRSGSLVFPKQVATELSSVKHPDAPGAWIADAKNSVRHPEPAEDTLVRVMGSAADVVEKNATRDPADPYVLAMALELVECYPDRQILLVTNDVVDRLPLKISVRTACGRLGLFHCPPEPFLTWLQGDEGAPLTHEDVVIPQQAPREVRRQAVNYLA